MIKYDTIRAPNLTSFYFKERPTVVGAVKVGSFGEDANYYLHHCLLQVSSISKKLLFQILQQILQINVAKTYLVPLWFSRQITEQIGAKLPKRDFPSIRMSRCLSKKRDKNIYKMPNIKRIWHFIYSSRKSSLYSA